MDAGDPPHLNRRPPPAPGRSDPAPREFGRYLPQRGAAGLDAPDNRHEIAGSLDAQICKNQDLCTIPWRARISDKALYGTPELIDAYRDPGWGDKNPGWVSGSTSSEAASRTQSPKGSVRTTVPVVSVTSNDRLRAEFSDAPDLSDSATISRPEARAS